MLQGFPFVYLGYRRRICASAVHHLTPTLISEHWFISLPSSITKELSYDGKQFQNVLIDPSPPDFRVLLATQPSFVEVDPL